MKKAGKTFLAIIMSLLAGNAAADTSFDLSAVDERLQEAISLARERNIHRDRVTSWGFCAALASDLMKKQDKPELYKNVARYCIRSSEIESREYVRNIYVNASWADGLLYLYIEYDREDLYALWLMESHDVALPANFDIISTWKPYADTGDPVAMFYLAREYDRDGKKALGLRWMKASAEAGLIRAQWTLHHWYKHGTGINEHSNVSDNDFNKRYNEENMRNYGGRVQYDAYESIRWLYRIASQDPTCSLVEMGFLQFSMQCLSMCVSLDASESEKMTESNRAAFKKKAAESPLWPIDVKVVQQAYVYASYKYMTTDDDSTAQSEERNLIRYAKLLSTNELEEAKRMSKEWRPRMELNPNYPLGKQPNNKEEPADQQLQGQLNIPKEPHVYDKKQQNIDNERLEIDRVRLLNENEAIREQQRIANEQIQLQERALDEQKRENQVREQQEKNRQTIEGMKTITEELHRQYPVYDPLAPGTQNNPLVIETK